MGLVSGEEMMGIACFPAVKWRCFYRLRQGTAGGGEVPLPLRNAGEGTWAAPVASGHPVAPHAQMGSFFQKRDPSSGDGGVPGGEVQMAWLISPIN